MLARSIVVAIVNVHRKSNHAKGEDAHPPEEALSEPETISLDDKHLQPPCLLGSYVLKLQPGSG